MLVANACILMFMTAAELVYVVDVWHRGSGDSLQGFPQEVDSVQEFATIIGKLWQSEIHDLVARLYIRSGRHEITHQTEWIA